MSDVITRVFQMVAALSLVGSYVILVVLLVRLLLRKAPKWCSYLLWGIVFLRLCCPVFPEAEYSLIPSQLEGIFEQDWTVVLTSENSNQLVAEKQSAASNSNVNAGAMLETADNRENAQGAMNNQGNMDDQGAMNNQGNMDDQSAINNQDAGSESLADRDAAQNMQNSQKNSDRQSTTLYTGVADTNRTAGSGSYLLKQIVYQVLSYLWLAGALIIMGYQICSYWSLKRKVRDAKACEPGVREVAGEHLSFVMGIFKPTIYLSSELDEESRRVVLCHEQVHLKRKDYLIKPVVLGICCIHWFNPLVWLAFYLMNKDCEMSCDEKVVSLLGEDSKKIYSYALLDEATRGESRAYRKYRKGSVCALLSFGEDNVKTRISHVLQYRKAPVWIIAGAVVLLVVLVVGLCSNPKRKSLTGEEILEKIWAAGQYDNGLEALLVIVDFENDDREEAFVMVGQNVMDLTEADSNSAKQAAKGDLWFMSEDGNAELLRENALFTKDFQEYMADEKQFLFVSYQQENVPYTEVYGVESGEAMVYWAEAGEMYVDYAEGEKLFCMDRDTLLTYDISRHEFRKSKEVPKKYEYYFESGSFHPYKAYEVSKEEIAAYINGEEILQAVEDTYSDAHVEYLARENDQVHINIACVEGNQVNFFYETYETTDGRLVFQEKGEGCYRQALGLAGEVRFTEKIAVGYGWRGENNETSFRISPIKTLERYATAYMDRDGNTLYELSHDKENFENWDKVTVLESGSRYVFGDSSPWVSSYDIEYEEGSDEATIRLILTNSAPEYYIAEEKVKLVEEDNLYYVDHAEYIMYDNIETREELTKVFDLQAEHPFDANSTGYGQEFPRIIFYHLLEGTNPAYYKDYTNPVTAAKKLLHLGEGVGEVTEVLYEADRQYAFAWNTYGDGLVYGEGSVVNVHYLFAKDGSTVDIPMVKAEESEGVWMLSRGDLSQAEQQTIGALPGDIARETYGEFADYDGDGVWKSMRIGSYPDNGIACQISSYGVYVCGYYYKCIYPKYISKYMCRDEMMAVDFYDEKMYFPVDSLYVDSVTGVNDFMYDSICELNLETGEYTYIPLSQKAMTSFPLKDFSVSGGAIRLYGENGSAFAFLLEDAETGWEEKAVTELSEEEKAVYGANMRQHILQNPNKLISVGNSTDSEIFALIDLDGDGATEEISMTPIADDTNLSNPMDHYKLRCGSGFENRTAENLYNDIFAFSPDGERIFIALYEDGPSGDPLTTIFKYDYNMLQSAGEFPADIRGCTLENGTILARIRNYAVQTDLIDVKYRMNESGNLEMISQESYEYAAKTGNEWVTLKVELPLHVSPESAETITIEPQEVRFDAVDNSWEWVLVETADGQQGWMHVVDMQVVDLDLPTTEVFQGLNMAG